MKQSDDLFQLIKSMSKSEKRFFKLFSDHHILKGEKIYIKLFNAIDGQNEYDEKKLLKLFYGKDPVIALSAAKRYLFGLVLRSLRLCYSGKTVESELLEMLDYIEVLHDKKLFKNCWKLLRKARKIASENEQFLIMLKIIDWEKKLLREGIEIEKMKIFIRETHHIEKNIINQYNNYTDYSWIHFESTIHYIEQGAVRKEKESEEYFKIFGKEVLKGEDKALSNSAKIFFHRIKGFDCFINAEYIQAYEHTKKMLSLIELSPRAVIENSLFYLRSIFNLSLICVNIRKYSELLELSDKVINLKAVSEEVKFFKLIYYYSILLEYYIVTGNFEEGVKAVQLFEKEFQFYLKKEDKELLPQIYCRIAYNYFGAKQYNDSLKWLNKFLNGPQTDLPSSFYCEKRIFNLILHYEIGNIDLLEYSIKSVYRFLSKREKLYEFEKCVLEFLKNEAFGRNSSKEIISAFKLFKEKLLNVLNDPFERKALEDFDYISWLDSKTENRDFACIIKERNSKSNPDGKLIL